MTSHPLEPALDRSQLVHDLRTPIAALLAVESHLDGVCADARSLMREAICRLQKIAEGVAEGSP